jgi:hypothetical protein
MTTTLSSYLTIANNLSQWQSFTAKTPAVQVATQYFEKNIGKVQSAQQLINNPRLFNYAMTAFGLSNMTYAKGMMQSVLKQGVSNPHALANTLNNSNILAFAKAFDFADNGSNTTSSSTTITNVVNSYIENSLENSQGQQDPGVQLALYFQNHAPNIKSVYNILADKSLLTVVQTALGISPLTAAEPIDTQAQVLKSQLKISDFSDPTKLKMFIERFAANYDANNASGSGAPPASPTTPLTTASLFQTQAVNNGMIGISAATLLSAENAHLGLL